MYKNYIDEYNSESGITEAVNSLHLNKPYVAYDEDNNRIDWNTKTIDYSKVPLTFEFVSAGTFWVTNGRNTDSHQFLFSRDLGKTWVAHNTVEVLSSGGTYVPVSNPYWCFMVEPGDIIQIKKPHNADTGDYQYIEFMGGLKDTDSPSCIVYGNIMSLYYHDDSFSGQTTFPTSAATTPKFKSHINLISANNLILPATALTEYCYAAMFNSCTTLTAAPTLPATTLAFACYYGMFGGCTSLTTAPELPATTLTPSCYHDMFTGCTSLTTAPSLPATTIITWDSGYGQVYTAYDQMFSGCSSLNFINCMAEEILEPNGTPRQGALEIRDFTRGVSQTGTFVKASGVTWTTNYGHGIPNGWTVVEE